MAQRWVWILLLLCFFALAFGIMLRLDWWLSALPILVVLSTIAWLFELSEAKLGIGANLLLLLLACGAVRYPGDVPADGNAGLERLWAGPAVRLTMQGEILIGAWHPFVAEQVITAECGMIWAGTASMYGLPVVGADELVNGSGKMEWRIFGLIPVAKDDGPDVTRSALGRYEAERDAWMPATNTADQVIVFDRWGNPDGGSYALHPFGVLVDERKTFEGRNVPTKIRAGWQYGTPKFSEFFRATISKAIYRER